MEIFNTFHQLIFPSRCISCKALGESLCRQCKTGWSLGNFSINLSRQAGHRTLQVRSSITYTDVAGRVILAAKESHLKSADLLIAEAISHSLDQWLMSDWVDTLIPIPSRRSASRKRGREFITEMTEKVSEDTGVAVATPLQHARLIRDQSALGVEARWNNLAGALVVPGNPERLGRVLLVDDLVTTGATLNEAARALRYAGIEVIGAVTAAITQTVR